MLRFGFSCFLLVFFTLFFSAKVQAAICQPLKMGDESARAWFDPVASLNEFMLPISINWTKLERGERFSFSNFGIVLKTVPLSGESFFGDEKAEFRIGSKTPTLFETRFNVRIGSALLKEERSPFLLLGKYEISLAQYAAVMGDGDLAAGTAAYILASKANQVGDLRAFAARNGECAGILSKKVHSELSKPVIGLPPERIRTFIRKLNLTCFAHEACSKILGELSQNPNVPAFFRLPSEYEWEYIARGGLSVGYGRLDMNQLERDVPNIPVNASLSDFAVHGEQNIQPIGSLESLHGFHDLFGNAEELTGSMFLSETLFGAAGGIVARGGHSGDLAARLRPSARRELPMYLVEVNRSKTDSSPFARAGFRLAVSLPIVGATKRIGSDELERIYNAAYSELGVGADRAGNDFNSAKLLRRLKAEAEPFRDEFDQYDPADFFRVQLSYFGQIRLDINSEKPVVVNLYDSFRQTLKIRNLQQTVDNITVMKSKLLLPGIYYASVKPAMAIMSGELKYGLKITATKAHDTGLSGAEINRASLKTAPRLSKNNSVFLAGYVGGDDKLDTFVLRASSKYDGVDLTIKNLSASISVHLLNSRGKKIGTRTFRPGFGHSFPFPVRKHQPLFVQVEASEGQETEFAIEIKPIGLYPPQMAPSLERTSPVVASSQSYSGYLTEQASQLFWQISLMKRQKVRLVLTGLDQDVDLTVSRLNQGPVRSAHRRKGTDPEVFEKSLAAGTYVMSLTRRSGKNTMAPFEISVLVSKPSALTQDEIAHLRKSAAAINVAKLPIRDKKIEGDITFFRLKNIPDITKLVFELGYGSKNWGMKLETKSGKVLARKEKTGAGGVKMAYNVGPQDEGFYLRVERIGANGGVMSPDLSVTREKAFDLVSFKDVSNHGQFGDWYVVRRDQQCWTYSHARSFYPLNIGHETRPYFRIYTFRRGGWGFNSTVGMPLNKRMKTSGKYSTKKGWKHARFRWGGADHNFGPYEIQKKRWVVNKRIRPLRRSRAFRIKGTTMDGEPAVIEYSLKGLKAALNKVATDCQPSYRPW